MKSTILENMTRAEREAVLLRAKAARIKTKSSTRPTNIPARTAARPHWPLSFAQQRLWFIAQQWPTAHILPFGLSLRGPLNEAALQAALDRIVQRHEALRTHFDVVDGQPVQRIADTGTFTLLRHDLTAGYEDDAATVEHWRRIEASAPFDLAQGPLIRGRLLYLGEHDHVLLLTMHHIVSDGWSMGVLASELGELYRVYGVQGLSPEIDPLPALPVQYPDYAVWQRRWLAGEVQEQQRAFWRKQLATAPALVSLPTDKPRPPVQDYRGQSLPVELDPELTAALKALSRRHGTTLYMTLMAAWSALVARLAGQDEVVIGTPVANRTRTEVEPLIGFFVNILALRLDLSDRPSVAQLLAQVREAVLQAQSHQDLPFEQVVEALKPQRTLAHSPVFQLTFAWQNTPDETLALDGLDLQAFPARAGEHLAQYDLELDLHEARGRIVGTLSFATALFEPATIQRYLGYLEAMLRGMVRDDAQAVDAIGIVGEAERRQVLTMWNETARSYPQGVYVHELFEQQAARTPDAVAIEQEGRRLTYRELDEEANRLAHQLRAWGVDAEQRVALCMRRGADLVLGMLAVLKAGGAYVPLDPAYPPERLRQTLSDSAPHVVLTHAELAASGNLVGAWAIWAMDGALRPWEAQPASGLPHQRSAVPERLAYVIYTSGSTGQPNGVMVEHRNLANLIGWHCESFPLRPGERTSSTAGVAFDACTWEVWPALCMGATLMLPPSAVAGDPSALLEWWEGQDLQSSFLVTALAEAALSRGQAQRRGLRTLLTGGDRLGRLPAAGLPFELVNNYGPTEATVVASSGVSRPDDTVVHIGRPIANTQIYLLDRHGRPVPLGAPGEIYIGGAQVARGYLNRPELTRERFVEDPFAGQAGARMYKTGDLGRWNPDGTLQYLGRNDQQVKLRGLRIELGEIEAQLARQPGIREVAVLAREDVPGEQRLVAYLVGAAGLKPDPQALRQALAHALPDYMVPAAYVVLEALPLTPNGKLDRRALPAPDGASFGQRAYEAPQGEVEIALAQIWSELLRVERVGRNDNFFELGGHSLLITRLVDGARRRGLVMDLRQVFDASTLKGLAAIVTPGHGGVVTHATLVPVRAAGSRRPLFCLHEGFGSVLVYERLARFIDADIPVYSVEASALHEDVPIYRPLRDMARNYLRQIAAVQPVGPYRFAGWSGGGLIAYEMAHQLLAQGESVEFLGLIDTYNMTPEGLAGDIAEAKHFLIRILEYTHPHLPAEVLRALLAFGDLDAMVAECHRHGWLRAEVTGREMSRRFQVANDIARACVEYVPTGLALDVDLFSAQEPARLDRSNGWARVLGPRLKITRVGGTHMSMMQDEALIAQVAGPMNRALLGIGTAVPCQPQPALHTVDNLLS
jgi:amino acid adenylation domain-containing protein